MKVEGSATAWIGNVASDVTPLSTRLNIGPNLFGISLLYFAIVGLALQRFWQPVPEDLPFLTFWLYVTSGVMAVAGAGVLFRRTRKIASLLGFALFTLLSLFFVPRMVGHPQLIAGWLSFAEHLAIALGGAALWASGRRKTDVVDIIRLAWGAFSIVFGLSHFLELKATVSFIPAWVPGTPEFWAILTGVAHIAVGVALITNNLSVVACRLGALMYIVFVAICWTPFIITPPQEWFAWFCIGLSTAMAGALWCVGDLIAQTRPPMAEITI